MEFSKLFFWSDDLSVPTPWCLAREAQGSWLVIELDNGTSGWI